MACIVLNKMAKVVAAVAIVLSFLSFKKALERLYIVPTLCM